MSMRCTRVHPAVRKPRCSQPIGSPRRDVAETRRSPEARQSIQPSQAGHRMKWSASSSGERQPVADVFSARDIGPSDALTSAA